MDSSLLIFAVLLSNGDEAFILDFIFRRDTDERIPYTESGLDYLPLEVCERFVSKQWHFSPVIFQNNQVHREIHIDAVLPILSETEAGAGGFGRVWKTCLDADCQKLVQVHGKKEVIIARKELEKGASGFSERAILDLVQTLKHPNIVEFLGSYSYSGSFNLLFPLATMDLKTFLYQGDHSRMEAHKVYSNVYGLADALSHIHDFSLQDGQVAISKIGYHHDLRPANILVDLDRSVFMISDFGLSRMKGDEQTSKTRLRGGQDDYLGPESFDYSTWVNGDVGRPLDVWAFACILSEVATFMAGKDVAIFRVKRKATHPGLIPSSDHAFHLNSKVRPAVEDWLVELVIEPKDSLVVQLVSQSKRMMNPHPHRRPKISELVPNLKLLAISSTASAVERSFRSHSFVYAQGPQSRAPILYLLESKRFQAWRSVFDNLHQAVRLELKGDILLHLTELYDALNRGHEDNLGSSLEGLPSDLLCIIDNLCKSLPETSLGEFQGKWIQNVCALEDIDTLQEIRAMAMPERYRLVGVGAAMKHMSMAISKSIQYGETSRYLDFGIIEVDPAPFPLVDKSKTMGFVTNDGVRQAVLVEWKVYDASWKGHETRLKKVMDDLANLLDTNVTPRAGVVQHRVPNCLGYFHEPHHFRFGFVYAVPGHVSANRPQLLSLNGFLDLMRQQEEEVEQPDLGDEFLLAKDLASCLLAVHQAGWLHKNLSSHHILIFCQDQKSAGRHLKFAVLSGFNDSRPEASSFTLGPRADHNLFRHPDYLPDVPFRKTFDYYGLGIVLLELGLCRTISELRESHFDVPGGEAFRLKLLESYVPQLGPIMGARYREAVDFCLNAERMLAAERERFGNEDGIQELFRQKVVDSLALCIA
ncbi:Serine/threonine protein kinase [Fusarium sp. LHS14.1]|nr:Serine/threonine protein kinase [Fusarium sp. LHS14.1]